ncbi:histidine phosphatase family protein [Polymorphobacter sp.]|uniref:histidine phosphatase family protein n=1 Tax=Polymorphobacter sp. TaxID=1909290 RepID=UPI003F6F6CFB
MDMILARHAETVFNAAAVMQGRMEHSPLTRAGIAQAEAMGAALAASGLAPGRDLWVSPSGRTQQTAAIIGEHLGRNFSEWSLDPRLLEIDVGEWQGRSHADIVAERGAISDPARRLLAVPPPGGEWFPDIARRLEDWLAGLPLRPLLVISHGVTCRVLRGLLAGGEPWHGVRIADDVPQGTILHLRDGGERVLHLGNGAHGMRAA